MKPRLRFSNWYHWEERNSIPSVDLPGIYLIAITRKKVGGQRIRMNDVSYIGMTTSRGGLKERINSFGRSMRGLSGHSGGYTVFLNLGNSKKWLPRRSIFVAILPVVVNVNKRSRTPADLIKMGWISFLEKEAMAKFKKEIKKEPRFNTN